MNQTPDFQTIPADFLVDPLYWVDEEGRIAHANTAGCRALGYSLDELTALYLWDIDVPLTPQLWATISQDDSLAKGITSVSRRKDGSTFPVELYGRSVTIDGVRYFLSVVRDISPFVQLEKDARNAARNVQTIMDNIPDFAWLKDENSQFIAVNQATADSFGISPPEAVGKSDFDFSPHENARRYLADDRKVLATGQRLCVEEPFQGKDGFPMWIETIKTPTYDGDGNIVGTAGIARDITDRKIAEMNHQDIRQMLEILVKERTAELREEISAREAADAALIEKQTFLETIINGTSTIIFAKDRAGRYLLANKEYLKIGDWTEDQVLGKTDFDLFPAEVAEQLKLNDQATLNSHEATEFEEIVEQPKGRRVYISIKVPMKTPDGHTFAVCGIATDITEREEAQNLLREARDSAEIASHAKSDFLYVMSHELRTPLNAVIGFSEALMLEYLGPLNEKQTDYVQSIRNSGAHLLQIINEILDYAQIDAGRMVLNDEEVSPATLFANSLALVHTAERTIAIDIADSCPNITADNLRLRQVMVNLIGNAVKFSPPTSTITLRARLRDDGGVTISVQDTGIGIAAEDIPRVREMFTQLDSPLNRLHAGTGVGLPLAISLTSAHGGTLDITSAPGQGTEVLVHLPPERSQPRAPADEASSGLDAHGGKLELGN